jgi:hypothetical protein
VSFAIAVAMAWGWAGTAAGSTADTPTVTGVSPATGPPRGGTPVTITGSDFASGASVTVGMVAATDVTVDSSTSLTAVTPANAAGVRRVLVTTADGTSPVSTAARFTYVAPPAITGLSPPAGPVAGGTPVTITGSGFSAGAIVLFGSTAATNVVAESPTSITATAPAGLAGTDAVRVTTDYGSSAKTSHDLYMYDPVPTISELSPSSGDATGGGSVVISGAHFKPGASVMFGSVAATDVDVMSTTTIAVTVPAQAPGEVGVTVATPGGTSGAMPYVYLAPDA